MPSEKTQFKKGNKLGKKFKKGNKVALGKRWNQKSKRFWISCQKFGAENPAWKGGISDLIQRIRRSFKYRQWRSDVFTRDDFTCQECGDNKGGNLEAHHIDSFVEIIRRNKIKTIEQALDCEELWNINNGLTLCKKCHRLIRA